ncbi:MAG: TonB-dependent receptor [Bacteroidia bacterium]|nr:TonB-dependent receptor [Bacteroidia bacterium]
MKTKSSLCLFVLFLFGLNPLLAQTKYTISGFVKELGSEETLIGASVAVPKLGIGTVTNAYGFYSLTLPVGSHEMLVSYVGFKPKAFVLNLDKNIQNNIELQTDIELKEVVVNAAKQTTRFAEQTQMSVIEIPVSQIKDIPALLGEKDVLKVIQLLPGVQKGSEGNSGIYVRGGGPDQNLIILDDATVYNAFHLFGFFSLFNGDALKSVELTKGGFPARYGGRLSSVIDMRMKEGNKERFKGEAGIGILSSRLTLEGPLIKGKSSFLVSGRRTYFDVLSRPLQSEESRGGYYFYDLNLKANYDINDKNKIYLSGYFGRDKFYFSSKYDGSESGGSLSWGNATGTLRWNQIISPKLFSNASFIVSNYQFRLSQTASYQGSKFLLEYSSGIRDYSLKYDFDYRPNANHTLKFGAQIISHNFTPSAYVLSDSQIGLTEKNKQSIHAWENALYAEDDIKVGARLKLNPGLRISHFNVRNQNYVNLEPRINTAYKIKNDLAIKASYAMMNQYIHLLSNTGIGLPTDLWVPSTDYVKPQNSWQLAAGIVKDFLNKGFSISLEGYYKESGNIITYKEGASFFDYDPSQASAGNATSWENNLTFGRAKSYGAEFFLQKKQGSFTGWIGYTLSWTKMRFDEVNFGKEFFARYDRRHDISIVGMYELRKEKNGKRGIKLSTTWVYGTGNAITLPLSNYIGPRHRTSMGGFSFWDGTVSEYTDRNAFRMAAYHRLDLGLQFQKQLKHYHSTIEISVYNLYNRYNPFFYYIDTPQGSTIPKLMQITLFPIIPSISYNVKF